MAYYVVQAKAHNEICLGQLSKKTHSYLSYCRSFYPYCGICKLLLVFLVEYFARLAYLLYYYRFGHSLYFWCLNQMDWKLVEGTGIYSRNSLSYCLVTSTCTLFLCHSNDHFGNSWRKWSKHCLHKLSFPIYGVGICDFSIVSRRGSANYIF